MNKASRLLIELAATIDVAVKQVAIQIDKDDIVLTLPKDMAELLPDSFAILGQVVSYYKDIAKYLNEQEANND